MNINPVDSAIKLKQQSHPHILFGTEVDEQNSGEQLLLSMYDSVQTSIFVVDVLQDGDFQYVALNPTHERWVGIRSEDLRGKKPEDILTAVDAAKVRQHYADCVRFGKTISYEQCLQFQGVSTWWSTTLTPLRDTNSKIYRLIGTSSNITAVKQTAQAREIQAEGAQILGAIAQRIQESLDLETILYQTAKDLRQCLKCDRILIYQIKSDNNGAIVAESTILPNVSLLGKHFRDPCFTGKYKERQGRCCLEIIEDIYAAGVKPCQRDFLASMQVRANIVVPIALKSDLWGLLIAQYCDEPHQWQQIEIDLLKQLATQLGIAIQNTKLQQQLKQLQTKLATHKHEQQAQVKQSDKFQALVLDITEKTRDYSDETQVLATVTQELANLFQLESCYIELYNTDCTAVSVVCEYAANQPTYQGLTRQIADFSEIYQPLLQKQHFQTIEIVPGWHPQLLVITQLACPIFDAQGMLGNLWLIRPIQQMLSQSEICLVQTLANLCAIAIRQAKLDATNQARLKKLEQRESLTNKFLRKLSQELRTPITSISLAAQTLETVLSPTITLDEIIPQLLQILHNECGRESKLINDLLTLTYLQTKPEPPTLISIDFQTWLPPIVESFRDLSSCQQQRLNLMIEPGLPRLETDITELERIVTELLSHTCKYTPAGESITVSAQFIADTVQLSISNSGLEIPTHVRSRIFEPFYHISNNDPWKYSGTGLEMALVQKMVRHLGGSISVESGHGQTTFIIRFPGSLS
ncbi:GAF domain-containing protein [Anabaena sp. FACHB-709]|uniref:histidine kinase n=2 Tax=Nostocaceae TaxID=1162 RepID=A0A1Z4KPJ3_ANAVA|nr:MULTISPECIES: GAF domain-containing protein [Nostocaceae]BAY70870.1 two-component sensor histidine kinase [Trichormus variabilis NIES-23]HBW31016.1 PAS domain S-box protein [Nostoc sp. UBA8866]MBD2171273.1 GAF domain-containing protein [Anabaena cylindrica FACHB-318]MBD2263057.1 GAF domain-containing protein [Anabaena sp. FACHB-709]MBD2272600.1 GAF domain-containing protein [Nostoc sp. PCC 7120 = FACHB-418]